MTEDEGAYFGARIEDEDKIELVKELLRHGEQSKILRDVVDTIVKTGGYDRHTVFDSRIEQKKETLQELRRERRHLDEEIGQVESELEQLRERRENILSQQDEYEIALAAIERPFRAGEFGHVDVGHARIQELAEEYGRRPDDVHQDLRDRNPDVPDYAFSQYGHVSTINGKFEGLPGSKAALPPDEREPLD